ncbi:sulfite exporter TauE/SafE family protein [Psychromarinibacter halotolerans]|uniref:Probable membrane transporter protein n=1 Tax=Psychromarinibacter halotolerans TaxID=1775175 RepID=A0ABV7GQ09_9RHOB|nr:sulfite exporter TauE/SafE family protein [Psychromarinibacter halotolerans]MDF0594755.1 sulfite exporter TauE/SafE family protein [Psychromarinibacter halotolerans]
MSAELLGEFALIFVALALGGLLKGAIGAGAPVVAVPVMALFFDVQLAVVVMVIPNLVSNLWQGWQHRAQMLPRRFTLGLALSGAIGAGTGSVILAVVPSDVLLLVVAVMVLFFILFRLARPDWGLSYPAALKLVWPAGFLAGNLQGATGVSAPVSISFLSAMRLDRLAFLATISVFFALMSVVQIPVLWAYGLMDWQRTAYGIAAIVPLLAFMPVGNYIARFLPPKLFDRIIMVLLTLVALRMIWKALA